MGRSRHSRTATRRSVARSRLPGASGGVPRPAPVAGLRRRIRRDPARAGGTPRPRQPAAMIHLHARAKRDHVLTDTLSTTMAHRRPRKPMRVLRRESGAPSLARRLPRGGDVAGAVSRECGTISQTPCVLCMPDYGRLTTRRPAHPSTSPSSSTTRNVPHGAGSLRDPGRRWSGVVYIGSRYRG